MTVTTELDAALEGADFVFSAIRVGGLAARVQDERVALELGVLGQETTGPGGIAYGLRTVPVARWSPSGCGAVAPDAWVINFTNPAGMITEAMRASSATASSVSATPRSPWRSGPPGSWASTRDARRSRLRRPQPPRLAARAAGRRRGPAAPAARRRRPARGDRGGPAVRAGLDPGRSARCPTSTSTTTTSPATRSPSIRAGGPARGEFLAGQQRDFYAAAAADPSRAHELWTPTRAEREATYMAAEHAGQARGGEEGDRRRRRLRGCRARTDAGDRP